MFVTTITSNQTLHWARCCTACIGFATCPVLRLHRPSRFLQLHNLGFDLNIVGRRVCVRAYACVRLKSCSTNLLNPTLPLQSQDCRHA